MVVLPRIADYGKVWGVVTSLSTGWTGVLVALALANVLTNGLPWMAALPGLSFVAASRVALAPNAVTTLVPGGGAISVATQFGMLRSWGLDRRAAGIAATVTNVAGQLVAYGFPLVAIAALSADGGHERNLGFAAVGGLVVFAVLVGACVLPLWSERLALRVGDFTADIVSRVKALVRARPVDWDGDDLVRFRREALDLLRRRWHLVTIATLLTQLAVFAVLIATLHAVGDASSHVDIFEAFAAWSLIRVLGKLPITPAGFGVEEIALTGALIGFGADNADAVSVTLIYRFLTVVPLLVTGLVAAATYRVARPELAARAEATADETSSRA